jgi:hypothetical protein
MSRIAIIIQKPVNTLVTGHINEYPGLLIQQQPDGQFILHGEADNVKALLLELRQQILLRKANAKSFDKGTAEYYQTNLNALQEAISHAKQVESILDPEV